MQLLRMLVNTFTGYHELLQSKHTLLNQKDGKSTTLPPSFCLHYPVLDIDVSEARYPYLQYNISSVANSDSTPETAPFPQPIDTASSPLGIPTLNPIVFLKTLNPTLKTSQHLDIHQLNASCLIIPRSVVVCTRLL